MRAYLTLTRRELATYFLSWTGYVIMAASALLLGLGFVILFTKLRMQPTPVPMLELFYATPFFWIVLLLAAPVITMRLFAQEKFAGTFETLMTTPVSDAQVVLAKFSGALVFYLLMWTPLAGCLALVRVYAHDAAVFEAGPLAGTALGVLLLGGLFLSLGCLASALTRSQLLAAMTSLTAGVALILAGLLLDRVELRTGWLAEPFYCLALQEQMQEFARGMVDTRAVVFHLSLTGCFLFLTLRAVESRRWR